MHFMTAAFQLFIVFMSEDGLGCMKEHREDIMKCVNASVPGLFDMREQYSSNVHLLFSVFSQQNCRYVRNNAAIGKQTVVFL